MPPRRPPGAQARAERTAEVLEQVLPEPIVELAHEDPWQLLVATILSAQSTDAMVNKVTPELFRRWPGPAELAAASREEVEEIVHRTGFYRQKAKAIQGAARAVATEHGGEVPDTMAALTTLPGVGRKTAAVVLGTVFGKAEGISVDTHCYRVARRLKLTNGKSQDHVEADLMRAWPRETWPEVGHRMVLFGRYVCTARKPACPVCPLNEVCPSAEAEPGGDVEERVARARLEIAAESPFQGGAHDQSVA